MRACLHRTLCTAGPHVFVSWSPCPTLHFPNEETDPTYRAAQGPAVENPGLAVPSHTLSTASCQSTQRAVLMAPLELM